MHKFSKIVNYFLQINAKELSFFAATLKTIWI